MTHHNRNRHRGRLPDVGEFPGGASEENPPIVKNRLTALNREPQRGFGKREEQSLHAAVNDPTISISATWRERCMRERAALACFVLCVFSGFLDSPAEGLFLWVGVSFLVIGLLRVLCGLLARIGNLLVFPSTNVSKPLVPTGKTRGIRFRQRLPQTRPGRLQ